jgi:hypothetical protein
MLSPSRSHNPILLHCRALGWEESRHCNADKLCGLYRLCIERIFTFLPFQHFKVALEVFPALHDAASTNAADRPGCTTTKFPWSAVPRAA